MADAWGGAWSNYWGTSWGASTAEEAAATGGWFQTYDEYLRRKYPQTEEDEKPKRKRKRKPPEPVGLVEFEEAEPEPPLVRDPEMLRALRQAEISLRPWIRLPGQREEDDEFLLLM